MFAGPSIKELVLAPITLAVFVKVSRLADVVIKNPLVNVSTPFTVAGLCSVRVAGAAVSAS